MIVIMSSIYKSQVYEKPILTLIYQPWDRSTREAVKKWKSHRSWSLTVNVVSCLDSVDVQKKHGIRRFPCALITDVYGETKPAEFSEPWDIRSIELIIIGE